MLRGLLRLTVIVLILVGVGAFFMGYRWAGSPPDTAVERPIGTSGVPAVDTSRAREFGAVIGESAAVGMNKAEQAVADASLTTKIKAKMALDDTVKALAIDVDTNRGVVTLSGRVASLGERSRALELATETDGVTAVIDHLSLGY